MLTLTALIVGFLLCALPAWWVLGQQRASSERELQRLRDEADRAATRAAGLEAMLDEIRARETQTTPPPTVSAGPPDLTLPREVQEQLDAIEDVEGREELAQLARLALTQNPNASADYVVREVFGG